MSILQRLSAVVLGLLLIGGNAAVCAEFATPESRMACCATSRHCPMHDRDAHRMGSHGQHTQSQADTCCAISGGERSSRPSPTILAASTSAILGTGVVVPVTLPRLILSGHSRSGAPPPTAPVPRHVLLSVFLV